MVVQIVFNSSPLIFLSRLDYLRHFLNINTDFYLPQSVADEINAKQDDPSRMVQQFIDQGSLQVRDPQLLSLATTLNQRLGKGESDAIAIATEYNADFIILDDATTRREAQRLGLTVRGTLAIIRKLQVEQTITVDDLEELYRRLVRIGFRVKRKLFEQIFED